MPDQQQNRINGTLSIEIGHMESSTKILEHMARGADPSADLVHKIGEIISSLSIVQDMLRPPDDFRIGKAAAESDRLHNGG